MVALHRFRPLARAQNDTDAGFGEQPLFTLGKPGSFAVEVFAREVDTRPGAYLAQIATDSKVEGVLLQSFPSVLAFLPPLEAELNEALAAG